MKQIRHIQKQTTLILLVFIKDVDDPLAGAASLVDIDGGAKLSRFILLLLLLHE